MQHDKNNGHDSHVKEKDDSQSVKAKKQQDKKNKTGNNSEGNNHSTGKNIMKNPDRDDTGKKNAGKSSL